MAFPTRLLNEEETLVLDLHPHWRFFAGPALLLVVAIIALIALMVNEVPDLVITIEAGITLAALVWVVGRYLRWVTTNFVVTTDRLIYRSGVFGKSGTEIPLERVNTMFFNQTIIERLLHSGDLTIESGGETGKQTFSDIASPSSVQNTIYKQIEANEARMSSGGAHVSASRTISQELRELDDLRRGGLLSDEEFETQKQRLLES